MKKIHDWNIKGIRIHLIDLVLSCGRKYKNIKGKLKIRWLGPYVLRKLYENGSSTQLKINGEMVLG